MERILLTFTGSLLLLTACSPEGNQANSGVASQPEVAVNVEAAVDPDGHSPIFDRAGFIPMKDDLASHWAEGMTCSPENLDSTSTLRATFLRPHGGEIAIITPSGEWYIYAWLAMTEDRADLRDAERMREANILDISVRNAVGLGPKSDGRPEPIFRESGTYRLMVSPNIEVDRESLEIDSYCHFNFRSKG